MEGLANFFSQSQIVVVHGIVGDRRKFCDIHLAVFTQHRCVDADIDDSAHQAAGLRVIGNNLAFPTKPM